MKAKNVEDPEANNETATAQEPEAEVAPLLKPKEIEKIFKEINTKLDHFSEYALDLKIENDETLVIAENNVSDLTQILKSIESVRKVRKQPYMDTGKAIDAFAKTLKDPLEKAKAKIVSVVTNYKQVKEAQKRLEAEKVRKAAEKKADEKAKETDKIHRIRTQLLARTYGGFWFDKNQVRKSSAGCLKADDCDALMSIIDNKIPAPDTFTHMSEEYADMVQEITNVLSEHKANLINLSSDSETLRKDAQNLINEAKIRAGIQAQEKKEELTKDIVNEAKSDIKAAEKDVKEAGKGVRKTVKWEIYDFDKIPRRFLSLDDTAIRDYIAENKDKVKQQIKDGEVVIDGLNFFVTDAYVSR